MRRTHQALITLALGLGLVTATTAAWATPPTGTQGQADQRRPLYQPQPDPSLQQRAPAGSEQERTLARHRALGAIAAQPAPKTDPAAPSPGVNLLATLLVGLVGGVVGGAAAMLGWTATTRRLEFYDRFFKRGAHLGTHPEHLTRWHERLKEADV